MAAQYAASVGAPLLAVDLQALAEAGASSGQALTRTLRQAKMTGALAYFRNAEAARAVRLDSGADARCALSCAACATRPARRCRLRSRRCRSRRGWICGARLTAEPPPDALITQRLTPSEIVRAAELPRRAAAAVLKQHRRRPDHALLTSLPTPYEWDDLVLPADVTAQLRAFENQVRLRWTVYEEWGFARLTHLGHGIAALFGGPSGTGKTMAAQVMAKSLGLELLRVDLAGVVNKYIGETEKKLREVFDACEDSGALLFFDEADALFGNRTQVKDAHDRFANIEIDYLLQRIERFDGVAVLATNRRQDLDPAFVRRLRFVIEFLPPRPGGTACPVAARVAAQCAERRDDPRRDRLRLSCRPSHHDRRRNQEHRAERGLSRARRGQSNCHTTYSHRRPTRDGQAGPAAAGASAAPLREAGE